MNRGRSNTIPLNERVASLESEAWTMSTKVAKHEASLTDHEKWLNQVRGSLRTLAALWAIVVALLGAHFFQEWVSRPAAAEIRH